MFSQFPFLAFGAVLLLASNVTDSIVEKGKQQTLSVEERLLFSFHNMIMASILEGRGDNVNQDIAANILGDYDNRVAPDHSDVEIYLYLRRIVDFDVNTGLLTLNAWFQMQWEDPRLSWSHPEVKSIVLPSDSIWIPDITLYNSATGYVHYDSQVRVVVNNTGIVVYIPPTQFTTYCKVPDDYDGSQNLTCTLEFISWAYDGNQLNLTAKDDGIATQSFDEEHPAGWSVMSMSYKRYGVVYTCCPQPYFHVKYSIVLHADSDPDNHSNDADD